MYVTNGNGLGEIFIQQKFQLHSTCTSFLSCTMYHASAGHSFQFGWAGHHQPPSQLRSLGCPAKSTLFSSRWAKNQHTCSYMYMYCLHSILYHIIIARNFPLEEILTLSPPGCNFYPVNFFCPMLLTFAVWVKYFRNAKEAELGEIFVEQKFLAVQNIHTHCKCTCTCISCQDIIWEKGGSGFCYPYFPLCQDLKVWWCARHWLP